MPTPSNSADPARALAFRTHVEPELEVLLRVARTLTGNPADAEDLVQETVIRAFRALERFDGAHPRAWLLTILRHTNMNMHRRQRPDLVEDWAAVQGAKPAFGAAGVPSVDDMVVDHILDEDLEKAVSSSLRRMLTCHWSARRIQRYLDHDPSALLEPGEVRRLEEHLTICEKCTQVAAEHQALNRALARLSGQQSPDPASLARLHAAVDRLVNEEDE